uniref:Protein TALPID3 n=1 Tax=Anabas testudineus TaxID=64144 RepID=A0AAQ6IIY5_ANATE
MFSQPVSSSHALWDLSGQISPDQSPCSSDTGDVLIRSTRAPLPSRKHGAGPGSVHITVHKLRDPPTTQCLSFRTEKQQRRPTPRQKPDTGAPARAAAEHQPGIRQTSVKKPEATKENRQLPEVEQSAGPERDRQPGTDLLTSCFTAGGRGVVLAALKQRSHSAPHRREVNVQLLDPGQLQNPKSPQDDSSLRISSRNVPGQGTSSQNALGVARVQMEAGMSSGHLGDGTSAAAAAAAAVAPLIKAQSDMEARVSQLVDGVEKLLQADRVGGIGGRGLNHHTLQHLDKLQSQQLQLQSQLLESALRIVTGHAAVTSINSDLTSSAPPAHLQVTHLDAAAANVLSNQQQSSSATRAASVGAVETDPVAMVTPHRDRWTEQTSVSMATHPPEGTHLQSSANYSQEAAKRANEVLREMGRLKSEMKILLTPENSLRTTSPLPDHLQSQQNQTQSQQNYSNLYQNHSGSEKKQSNHSSSKKSQSHENQSHPKHFQSQPNQTQSLKFQSHQSLFQEIQSKHSYNQQSQSMPVQRSPVVPSLLEEAGQVLRRVQRQKKHLEENLEALLRVKTGEVLHCQLEALAANRDWTEEVRIKKTVDAWINTLTKDIQAEISEDAVIAVTSQQGAAECSPHSVKGRPMSTLRRTGSKTASGKGSRLQTAVRRVQVQRAEPDKMKGVVTDSEQVEGESYLTRLYGRAPYEGLRRTLKKSPYLRFSSPASALGRKPRPRLVESVRGVKVKSCKTQTCLAPPFSLSPVRHHRPTFSATHMTSTDRIDIQSVPMAIPLGHPRVKSSSRRLNEHQQEVTSPPRAPLAASVVAMDNGAPEQQSHRVEQLDAGEAPRPPSRTVDIERKSEEEEDEELIFPGTDFESVADVVQEEVSVVGEEAVELDGGPSPPPVLYQGPHFPPQAPCVPPAQDQGPILVFGQHRDALEDRLVEWVEQQLMSRMISEMYHPPCSDPAQNISTDQSEAEERSFTSDIVEAVGGAGLQLFVDSNMEVDSALIRQLVNEVLTETVTVMLGQKDALNTGPEPGPAAQEETLILLVPTPVPTPSSSPIPSGREVTPLATPPLSEPISQLNEDPQPITEHVATPTSSPEPAPSAGSPPDLNPAPPTFTWGDAELPLDEERPEEHLETHSPPLLMSVAEEEPPLSSPHPPPTSFLPPAPSPSPPPPAPDPRPVSPSISSDDSSSSSSSSSSAVTGETEAALKHISEGELLVSVKQQAALTEEEAACSFSSSLRELQDMDFDSPSEGQVRDHDLLLNLLTKMEQGASHQGERPQPESSCGREEEVSVGEVRTTEPYEMIKGMSARQDQTFSPGQVADVSEVGFESTNQDLMGPLGTLTSDLQTDLSLSLLPAHLENTHTAAQVVPFLVKKNNRQTGRKPKSSAHAQCRH